MQPGFGRYRIGGYRVLSRINKTDSRLAEISTPLPRYSASAFSEDNLRRYKSNERVNHIKVDWRVCRFVVPDVVCGVPYPSDGVLSWWLTGFGQR